MHSISPSVLVVTVAAASLLSAAAAALTVRLAGAALASRIQLATIGRMRIILVALVTAAAVSAQRPEDLIAAGPMFSYIRWGFWAAPPAKNSIHVYMICFDIQFPS